MSYNGRSILEKNGQGEYIASVWRLFLNAVML